MLHKDFSCNILPNCGKHLLKFIQSGLFKNWDLKQTEPIDGVSAHRSISQTYANTLAASQLAKNTGPLPKGSIIVKTMFESDRMTEAGHALMIKVEDASSEDSWLWYEGFSPNYSSPFYGTSLSICTACHSSGIDYVRSQLP